ncbi:MAG TPA: substrate-binding domain-containing protein [Candidatus Sulfotelmatobacter sp.]
MNNAPGSASIPQRTKDRGFAVARELHYPPNPLARALRTQASPAAAAGVREIGNACGALMFVGAENFLRALRAMREAGLTVPGDISIVSCNPAPAAPDGAASAA